MKKYKNIILITAIFLSFLIGYAVKPTTIKTEKPKESNTPIAKENKADDERNYKRDLNKDGFEEEVNVIFKYDKDDNKAKYIINIESKKNKYSFEKDEAYNVIPEVKFADFDTKDDYIEFYIRSDGPSDDPICEVYRFCNDGIKEVCVIEGDIHSYDGEGNIYTSYSKTYDKFNILLSYYDINKVDIVYNDKKNIIGNKLQYDNSLILFADLADTQGSNNSICNSIIDDNIGKKETENILSNYNKENIVKVCEPNEILTITDIDNTYHGVFKEGKPRNIRIKVKTSDGKEGWLNHLNGGD